MFTSVLFQPASFGWGDTADESRGAVLSIFIVAVDAVMLTAKSETVVKIY